MVVAVVILWMVSPATTDNVSHAESNLWSDGSLENDHPEVAKEKARCAPKRSVVPCRCLVQLAPLLRNRPRKRVAREPAEYRIVEEDESACEDTRFLTLIRGTITSTRSLRRHHHRQRLRKRGLRLPGIQAGAARPLGHRRGELPRPSPRLPRDQPRHQWKILPS